MEIGSAIVYNVYEYTNKRLNSPGEKNKTNIKRYNNNQTNMGLDNELKDTLLQTTLCLIAVKQKYMLYNAATS